MRKMTFIVLIFALLFTTSCSDKSAGLEDKLVAAINAGNIKDVKIELSKETFKKSAKKDQTYEQYVKERLNNNMDNLKRSPLMWASFTNQSNIKNTKKKESKRLYIVKYLLDNGADCNKKDINGWTALFWASWSGMDEIASLIIDKCSNINDATSKKWTPLMAAALKGNVDVVKLLLKKGADKSLKNSDGKTAFDIATANKVIYFERAEEYNEIIPFLK